MPISPRVSIGLPVYNGARYLSATLEALLCQTYADIEIIVSDNHSIDATLDVVAHYAARDPRVRLHCHDRNRGAAANFNRVFALARGEFFKWAAHDDLCHPKLIEQCVRTLVEHPSAVLAFPKTLQIDSEGNVIGSLSFDLRGYSPRPSERFRRQICINHWCVHIFGLIRSAALLQTHLIAPFVASDRVLLAHLALLGTFVEIPEPLFFHREHAERSTYVTTLHDRAGWFDTSKVGKVILPHWRLFFEYMSTIWRCRLSFGERVFCHVHLLRWLRLHSKAMLWDVSVVKQRLARGALSAALRNMGSRRPC